MKYSPITEKDLGNGKFSLDVNCEYCGKPITKTSQDFGMDCEDNCGRKEFVRSGGPKQVKKLLAIAKKL
jgi:hypothetical protein